VVLAATSKVEPAEKLSFSENKYRIIDLFKAFPCLKSFFHLDNNAGIFLYFAGLFIIELRLILCFKYFIPV